MEQKKPRLSWGKRLGFKSRKQSHDSNAGSTLSSSVTTASRDDLGPTASKPIVRANLEPALGGVHASSTVQVTSAVSRNESLRKEPSPGSIHGPRASSAYNAAPERDGESIAARTGETQTTSEKPLPSRVTEANKDTLHTPFRTADTFWTRGYIQKRTESPDLILAYEALIADDAGGNKKPVPAPSSVVAGIWNKIKNRGPNVAIQPSALGTGEYFVASPDQMRAFIDNRMEAIQDKAWKIPLSQKTVDFQKQAQKIVRGILYVKDSVGTLASLDPHASSVWAGICLLLPLICNPVEQKEMLVDGLEAIVSTLCRLTVAERLYREEFCSTKTSSGSDDVDRLKQQFERESVSMIADIIEYQAKAACHTCQSALSVYVRDVFQVDDWKGTLQRITQADDSCAKLLSTLNEQKYSRHQRQLESVLEVLDKTAASLVDVQQLTLKEVQQGFKKLTDDMSELQVQEILDAVGTSNYEKHKRVIPEHVAGTCKWFTEHHQYQVWKNAKSDVLWLAADPGCGKSVLAKHLVDTEVPASDERAVCYFFFKDGLTEQQGLERALCALLHQLFTQRRALVRHALKPFAFSGKHFAASVEKLWSVLVNACADPSAGEIVFVVDALDECELEDRKELVRRVSNLYMFSDTGPKGRVKFLLTSRPYHNINVNFQQLIDKLPHVRLSADQETAAIRAEIDAVVDHRLAQLAKSLHLDSATAQAMASKVKAFQNRTYLWVRLIFEALEAGQGMLTQDRAQLVSSIPSTVQGAYAGILRKCVNPGKARKVFQLMLASQSPLRVQQLNAAASISPDMLDEDLKLDSSDVFQEDIRQACGLFITVIDGKVYFIHQTAREFLTMEATTDPQLQTPIDLPLSVVDCHKAMAVACTQHIASRTRRKKEQDSTGFIGYAARFWDLHVAMASPACKDDAFDDLYERTFDVCVSRDIWWPWRIHEEAGPTEHRPQNQRSSDGGGGEDVAQPLSESERNVPDGDTATGTEAFRQSSREDPARVSGSNVRESGGGVEDELNTKDRVETTSPPIDDESDTTGHGSAHTSYGKVFGPAELVVDSKEYSPVPEGQDDEQLFRAAEIVALSFFGLVGVLWLTCTEIDVSRSHRRHRRHTKPPEQPMLQWLTSSQAGQYTVQLKLSNDDPLMASDAAQFGRERSYKIFWDKGHFDEVSSYSQDMATAWTNESELFTIAHSEAERFLDSLGDEARFELATEASQKAVSQVFVGAHAASTSVARFQQLLQRATTGGHLRELGWRFRVPQALTH